ncbi:DUF1338 family protein [Sinorhizobium meliloti]|nr:DUF1338 family protein [Sinorhizobium meliloti]
MRWLLTIVDRGVRSTPRPFRPVGDRGPEAQPLPRLHLASEARPSLPTRPFAPRRRHPERAPDLHIRCGRSYRKGRADGGLDERDADRFVAEVLETFRWHDEANGRRRHVRAPCTMRHG